MSDDPGIRPLHVDFARLLSFKEPELVALFCDLREFVIGIYPDGNELLYHTHALTAVFSISEKLSDAYCMLPIYTNHVNLGFNKGTLLSDPHGLLTGTGKLIRHIDVKRPEDYRNETVTALVRAAIELAKSELDKPPKHVGQTFSKIKQK